MTGIQSRAAPLDEDIAVQVTDGRGGPYTLQWPCRRTASGWINSRKGTPLEVTPVRWRPYDERPSRRLGNDVPPLPSTLARQPDARRLCRPGRQRQALEGSQEIWKAIWFLSVRRSDRRRVRAPQRLVRTGSSGRRDTGDRGPRYEGQCKSSAMEPARPPVVRISGR